MSESNHSAVVVPTIGESISSAFIAQWFKKVGEYVREGDPLLEVDSDKASLEVPSPFSGVVVELLADDGDEVPIGATIAHIDTAASAPEAAAPATPSAPTPSPDLGSARAATPSMKGL
jgi:2-oxoglutarate dehydrogenase E2 component (dihydrolipoamide succinyltransferase)